MCDIQNGKNCTALNLNWKNSSLIYWIISWLGFGNKMKRFSSYRKVLLSPVIITCMFILTQNPRDYGTDKLGKIRMIEVDSGKQIPIVNGPGLIHWTFIHMDTQSDDLCILMSSEHQDKVWKTKMCHMYFCVREAQKYRYTHYPLTFEKRNWTAGSYSCLRPSTWEARAEL